MNFHGGDIYKFKDREVLDFSSNINPLGVPDSFKEALINNINDFTKYPDIQYFKLRESIKDYLKIDNINYIVPGNGAVEIIYKAIKSVNPKKAYVISPTFSEYLRAIKSNGIEYEEVNVFSQDYGEISIKELLNMVTENSLVVMCNPNNPTGSLTSKDKICYLVEELAKINSTLLLDEAFIEFAPNSEENSMISLIEKYQNLIIVKAATKFFGMPGIRLGYGITANKNYIEGIKEGFEPWNINTSAIIASSVIFTDNEYIKKSKEWISTEREFLYNQLNEFKDLTVYKSNANFYLVKINREDVDAYKLYNILAEKGILIRVPKGFNYLSDFHFRLAVKDRRSNEILINNLKKLFK